MEKKQASNNRRTAYIVMVLCIAFAVVFGCGRSLGRMRREVLSVYEYGDDSSGKGLLYDIGTVKNNVLNLTVVGARYLDESDSDLVLARELAEQLDTGAEPSRLYADVQQLASVSEDLYTKLAGYPLTEMDETYRRECYANITMGIKLAENSSYNDMAEDFNNKLKKMPARLINVVTGVKPVGLFE